MTTQKAFAWTHESVAGLFKPLCVRCKNSGLLTAYKQKIPCGCVTRAIFRACWRKWKDIHANGISLRSSLLRMTQPSGPVNSPHPTSRNHEEFCADFELIAKRTLTDPFEYAVFRLHFLQDKECLECCQRLSINRGTFWHSVFRIEQKLGRAFRETEPYAIFPVDEYFGKTDRVVNVAPFSITRRGSNGIPLQPPLKPKAPLPVHTVVQTAERPVLRSHPGGHKKAA